MDCLFHSMLVVVLVHILMKNRKQDFILKLDFKKHIIRFLTIILSLLILVSFFKLIRPTFFVSETIPVSYMTNKIEQNTRLQFIRKIAPMAQQDQKDFGILSSITIAQACLESDFGRSQLSSKYFNLFGIKSYNDNLPSITLPTTEYENNKKITVNASFRSYENYQQSITDHSKLFITGVDWNRDLYKPVVESTDYASATKALVSSGYATDPSYARSLNSLIEKYNIDHYDRLN